MRSTLAWFQAVFFMTVTFSFAEKTVADHNCSMVSETIVYEIVKKVLITKFASVEKEIRKKISGQRRQISSRSDVRLLLKLNQRVSRLEDETWTREKNVSRDKESEIEILKNRIENLTHHVTNLESRVTTTCIETSLKMNDSNKCRNGEITNILTNIRDMETTLDNLSASIRSTQINQQIFNQTLKNFETKVTEMNEDILLANMRSFKNTSDDEKAFLYQMMKNISASQLKLENDLSTDQQTIKQEFLEDKDKRFRNLEKKINASVWMIDFLEKSFNKKLASTFENATKMLDDMKDRFSLDNSNINETILLSENMQNLEEKISKFNKEMMESKLEMSTLKSNLTEMVNNVSILNNLFNKETTDIRNQVRNVIHNVSLLNEQSKTNSEFENNFTRGLGDIRREMILFKKDSEKESAGIVKECIDAVRHAKKNFSNEVKVSVVNITKRMNLANDRIDLQGSHMNHTIGLIEEELKSLHYFESISTTNFTNLKKEFSELKRNETVCVDNMNLKIEDLTSNISLANEKQTRQTGLIATLIREISYLNDTRVLLLNSWFNETGALALLIHDLSQNLSMVEKGMELALNSSHKTIILNISSEMKGTEDMLMQLKEQQQEINTTIDQLHEEMISIFEEMHENLNHTSNSEMQHQSYKLGEFSKEIIQYLKSNVSFLKDSIHSTTQTVQNNVHVKISQINSRLDRFSDNINNLSRNVDILERSNNDKSSRLSTLESRTSTLLADVKAINSYFKNTSNGFIRLRKKGNSNPFARILNGTIEIYLNGAWGTVCDDGWDDNDATVVCRMLGYSDGKARVSAHYGEGSGQIWLDDVTCSGFENSILNCTHSGIGVHNCGHSEDAGVECKSVLIN